MTKCKHITISLVGPEDQGGGSAGFTISRLVTTQPHVAALSQDRRQQVVDAVAFIDPGIRVDFDEADMQIVEDSAAFADIMIHLAKMIEDGLGIIAPTRADPNAERMNNLEREQRNTGRAVNQISQQVAQLADLMTRAFSSAPAIAREVPQVIAAPIEHAASAASNVFTPPPLAVLPVPVDVQLTAAQQKAQSEGRPLVGTPFSWAGGPDAMSAPINPTARGGTVTPEMGSDQMAVHGRAPGTTIEMFSGQLDSNGQPIMVRAAMPVVGDLLRPLASKSDF